MQDTNAVPSDWQAPDPANTDFCDYSEESTYGDFSLNHVIAVTRCFGRAWGAQVLAQVPKSQTHACPSCGALTAFIKIADQPGFLCEKESHWNGEIVLANLICEHTCESGDEENKL